LLRAPNTALGSNPMRKSIPLRWIEEAEARQVLAIARYESPAPPFTPVATKTPWGKRVRRWVAAGPAGRSPEENTAPGAAVEPRQS
jgi:hypothetical protein